MYRKRCDGWVRYGSNAMPSIARSNSFTAETAVEHSSRGRLRRKAMRLLARRQLAQLPDAMAKRERLHVLG